MRVLLDECIPRKLKHSLIDHECSTVPEAGFSGKKNGALLDLAEKAGFEVFVTMDRGWNTYRTLLANTLRFWSFSADRTVSQTFCRSYLNCGRGSP